jgi:hypothetical protein
MSPGITSWLIQPQTFVTWTVLIFVLITGWIMLGIVALDISLTITPIDRRERFIARIWGIITRWYRCARRWFIRRADVAPPDNEIRHLHQMVHTLQDRVQEIDRTLARHILRNRFPGLIELLMNDNQPNLAPGQARVTREDSPAPLPVYTRRNSVSATARGQG